METKVDSVRLEKVRNKCGFTEGICVSSNGLSGGIGLWWRDLNVKTISFSSNHVAVDVLDSNGGVLWRAIGVYGWPERENKHKTWHLMKGLQQSTYCPIVFFGDFNEVLSEEEKVGGVVRSERCIDGFREAIDYTGTRDLGYRGSIFTWQRGLSLSTLIRERLDRFLACDRWCNIFPCYVVRHFPINVNISDHAPLLLQAGRREANRRKKRIFRFEAYWLSKPECEEVIKAAWSDNPADPAHVKLASCSNALSKWAAETFGSIKQKIRKAEEKLKEAQQGAMDGVKLEQCRAISNELDELHLLEESYWHARARTNELRDGDKNTSYFHHKASSRKKRNHIDGLECEDGQWVQDQKGVESIVTNYFNTLFTTDGPTGMDMALEGIGNLITDEMNEMLLKEPGAEEIRTALFDMHPNKAPGIDDDSILFARANVTECARIANIIQIYEQASGQKINFSKSEVTFSKLVPVERRRDICGLLGVREVGRHEKYLGIPTIIGRSKKATFSGLKERIWKMLQGWKEKLLSKPGKEILIKAVAQAIPTYLMSVFKIPEGLLDEIHSILARFWWGNGGEDKIRWRSWDSLCLPKAQGGMGFRNLKVFNQALLAKQGWRLLNGGDSLLHRVLKARYFKNSTFLEARRGFDPSFTWRSIWGAKSLFIEGLRWRVGDGQKIGVWRDKWLPMENNSGVPTPPPNGLYDPDIMVADLIDPHTKEWDRNALNLHLRAEDMKQVLSIPLIEPWISDTLYWGLRCDGVFSVKTAYWLGLLGGRDVVNGLNEVCWKRVWNMEGPPKLKHFVWRACNNSLAVNGEMHRRHIRLNSSCHQCPNVSESIFHALFNCTQSRKIWEISSYWDLINEINDESFKDLFSRMADHLPSKDLCMFATLAWAAWTSRNKALFENSTHDPQMLAAGLVNYVRDYNMYSARVFGRNVSKSVASVCSWQRPQEGVIKINVDAAILPNDKVGLGVVARDSHGKLLFTAAKKRYGRWEPSVAEAAAMYYGMELARRFGYDRIWMESDALGLIQKVRCKQEGFSYIFMFVKRIISLIPLFSSFHCSHIKRGGNTIAHLSARSCPPSLMEHVRFEPFPESFLTLAEMDIV